MHPTDFDANDDPSKAADKPRLPRPKDHGREEHSKVCDPITGDAGDSADSSSPLILDGAAESTSFTDADPSTGTVSEAPQPVEATVDLPTGGVEASVSAATTKPLPASPAYRPTRRPPMAVLHVGDDGALAGEEVRVRKTPFDVGRLDGDLVVPHELQMSRRHFRIDRKPVSTDADGTEGNHAQWTLTDLRSLNGTFLRKKRLVITGHAEALIGGEMVRFLSAEDGGLTLIKVAPGRQEEKVAVTSSTAWIGSDTLRCLPFLGGNPFLDARQLRLDRDHRARWTLSDLGSTNGLWVRVETAMLEDGDQWQAGEQRFAFELP